MAQRKRLVCLDNAGSDFITMKHPAIYGILAKEGPTKMFWKGQNLEQLESVIFWIE